jgi:hypothetical protein
MTDRFEINCLKQQIFKVGQMTVTNARAALSVCDTSQKVLTFTAGISEVMSSGFQ